MSNEKNELSGRIPTANIVNGACHPVEMAEENIVQQPVNKQPTVNVTQSDVTSTNTKRNICLHCGKAYKAKRPKTSCYCGAACRRAAWLLRNPEKAREYVKRDKLRLRAHLESRGIAWEER